MSAQLTEAGVQPLAPTDTGAAPPAEGGWLDRRGPLLLRDVAALVLLPVIVAVVALDVVTRYLLNHPLQWAQEIASLALLLVFVAAIPCATASDSHIRTETIYEHFGPRMRAVVDAFGVLALALVTATIAGWQVYELPGLYRRGEGAEFVDLPYWPISLALAICMAFGCLQLVVHLVRSTARIFRSTP